MTNQEFLKSLETDVPWVSISEPPAQMRGGIFWGSHTANSALVFFNPEAKVSHPVLVKDEFGVYCLCRLEEGKWVDVQSKCGMAFGEKTQWQHIHGSNPGLGKFQAQIEEASA